MIMLLLFTSTALAGRPHLMVNPCLDANKPFHAMPFCNASKPTELRIDDALQRMSVTEKLSALATSTPAIPSLGLNAYNWWTEATSGVAWAKCGACKTTKVLTSALVLLLPAAVLSSSWSCCCSC